MADVKWIKLIVTTRNGKSMKQIKGLPDGFKVALFWYELMQLAGECNEKGFLYYEQDFPYTDDMLANEFNYDKEFIKYALKIFQQLKMVELKDDAYQLSNWDKYQNLEKLARIRENTRERVARFREKKQLELQCNADVTQDVTQCNGGDIDIDIDIDNIYIGDEKSNELPKKYLSIKKQIEEFTQDKELQETLNQFVLMREKIKKKLTNYAFFRFLNKLTKLSNDKEKQIEILNRSIEKSWSDIYPLENNNNFKGNKKETPKPEWWDGYMQELEENKNQKQKPKMTQEEIDAVLEEAKKL